jgi:hypothetical protein
MGNYKAAPHNPVNACDGSIRVMHPEGDYWQQAQAVDVPTKTKRGKVTDSEYQQLMLERQQMLEEAFSRAQTGIATDDDWAIIRYECGLSALTAKGNKNVSHSEI